MIYGCRWSFISLLWLILSLHPFVNISISHSPSDIHLAGSQYCSKPCCNCCLAALHWSLVSFSYIKSLDKVRSYLEIASLGQYTNKFPPLFPNSIFHLTSPNFRWSEFSSKKSFMHIYPWFDWINCHFPPFFSIDKLCFLLMNKSSFLTKCKRMRWGVRILPFISQRPRSKSVLWNPWVVRD